MTQPRSQRKGETESESLELQCRETMEIRTSGQTSTGFEPDLEGLKAMETEAKQYDKEETFFLSSERAKKQARKNGPSQYTKASVGGCRLLHREFALGGTILLACTLSDLSS